MSTSTGEILGSGAMVSPKVAKPNKMLHPAGYLSMFLDNNRA